MQSVVTNAAWTVAGKIRAKRISSTIEIHRTALPATPDTTLDTTIVCKQPKVRVRAQSLRSHTEPEDVKIVRTITLKALGMKTPPSMT
jgi:hypothetical protein